MLSASPSTDRHILSLYQRHYKIKDSKLYHAHIPQSRLDQLLAQRKQDLSQVASQTQGAEPQEIVQQQESSL